MTAMPCGCIYEMGVPGRLYRCLIHEDIISRLLERIKENRKRGYNLRHPHERRQP